MISTQRPLRIDELFRRLDLHLVAGEMRDLPVHGIADDSRRVGPGSVFFAIDGTVANGAAFIGDALARGAIAVVTKPSVNVPRGALHLVTQDVREAVARAAALFHREPAKSLTCVGITGTNGKTTTAHMLRAIFRTAGKRTGMLGTIQHDLGARQVTAANTTPGPIELQAYLAEMRDNGLEAVVMEVSSHALEQKRVAGVPFRAGVLTNITSDHLDYHKRFEDYRDAKALLFEGLAPSAFAIVNAEDPSCAELTRRTRARIVHYGRGRSGADVLAADVKPGLRESAFELLCGHGQVVPVRLRSAGRYNVSNALAAASAALSLGIAPEDIAAGLAAMEPVEGRLEPIEAGQPFEVLVDYAHTEDALEQALSTLRCVSRGRLIVVFGCGGDRDKSKRPGMGRVAARWADVAVLTSDNPRGEDPHGILRDVEDGIASVRERKARIVIEIDRKQAIEKALSEAREGDVVLIAGKGHETYQIIGSERHDFDDRRVAREILAGMTLEACHG